MKMDVVVVEKCLDFCQGLVESNIKFNFNLFLAHDAFTFDNKELAKSSCEKKKKSPSQLRSEKERKEEKKNKKEDTAKVSEILILRVLYLSVIIVKPLLSLTTV